MALDPPPGYAELHARATAELARIRTDIPLPDRGIDLEELLIEELRQRYYLPPLPEAAQAPQLRALLRQIFTKESRFVKTGFEIVADVAHPASHAGEAQQGLAFASRWGTSRNWSGAVIAAHGGMTFNTIGASWTVPTAAAPLTPAGQGLSAAAEPGKAFQCSVWIGLDGYRLSSMSLPQMGTVSRIRQDGTPEYYAWVQWWVRGRFFGEAKLTDFAVSAGHRIHATLTVFNRTLVGFVMKNQNTGEAVNIVWNGGGAPSATEAVVPNVGAIELSPEDIKDNADRRLTPVEGHHAVWCVERPSVMPTDAELAAGLKPHQTRPFRMPAIDGGAFRLATATMRPAIAGTNIRVERDLTAARYIRMIDVASDGRVPRVATLTSPERPGPGRGNLDVAQKAAARILTPVA
jgi:hypothetical protein